MAFEKVVPEWNAAGTEPPSSLKTSGFQAGYKPPAPYFNWFWHSVSQCLTELQAHGMTLEEAFKAISAQDVIYDNTSSTLTSANVQAALNELAEAINSVTSGIPIVAATSSDGVAYTATVDGVTELTPGMQITIIPDTLSQSTGPTLNVNGLGAKGLRMLTGYNTAAGVQGAFTGWIVANRPITVKYNGAYWIVTDIQRTSGAAIYGNIAVQNGGLAVDDDTTDSDKEAALENLLEIGAGVPFWAVYGTTTNAEIEAAYQAGKQVYCKDDTNGYVGVLFAKNSEATAHFFISGNKIFRCFNGGWADISASYGFAPTTHEHDGEDITSGFDTLAENLSSYLGGAKIATGSYTGTGTYGSSNPCSLTFDFVPKVIMFTVKYSLTDKNWIWFDSSKALPRFIPCHVFSTSYVVNLAAMESSSGSSSYGKKSSDGKTIYWYNTQGALYQQNSSSMTHYYIAFG